MFPPLLVGRTLTATGGGPCLPTSLPDHGLAPRKLVKNISLDLAPKDLDSEVQEGLAVSVFFKRQEGHWDNQLSLQHDPPAQGAWDF